MEEVDAGHGEEQRHRGAPPGVVAVIAFIALGVVFLAVVAVVVGVIDRAQAPGWRRVAAERRELWESRQPQLHGPDPDDG
jgi:hypothetical protein